MRWSIPLFVLALAPLAPACGSSSAGPAATSPSGAEVLRTEGTIESIGEGRKVIRIKHDAIPGRMQAMTMPFEPGTAAQLDGLAVGDRVTFSFEDRDDGRRVIVEIKKK